jgi:tetratricopeptide (TPR) repeat protein
MQVVEENMPFEESLIWDLQRRYFDEMGMAAWQSGVVPHYATTNPRQANAYAEMVVALYKDYVRLSGAAAVTPLRILELGGGSGRFAYYLLRQLEVICAYEGISTTAFQYVLTDFTQSNLDYWRVHPRFQGYFESGALDMGLFDVTQPGPVALQISGELLGAVPSSAPLVVVANYLFDSIPQSLVYVDRDTISPVTVSVSVEGDPATMSSAALLEAMHLEYMIESATEPLFVEPEINAVLEIYRGKVHDAFVLFPAIGMRCLAGLRTFSQAGLLLITADKGGHSLPSVCFSQPPSPTIHGSFSLHANYHALLTYCGLQGGLHAFPAHAYYSVNTGCMLMLEHAAAYTSTQRASQKYLDDTGPDAYFTLYKCVRAHLETVSIRDILAALRLSLYDSHQLNIYTSRIGALLSTLQPTEAADLLVVLGRCWENYFPLQEERDLATILGSISYALDAYAWALFYFQQSTDIYGPFSGTYYNMATCYHMLGDEAHARPLLEKVLAAEPGNVGAQKLMATYMAAQT